VTKNEIRSILNSCLSPESAGFQSPSVKEWESLQNRFSCIFPTEMRDFIDLMAEYMFPGEILNVGTGPNNNNDTIEFTYDFEVRENPSWPCEMVPFYSIGNGDYFCVSSLRCPDSPVFYYYHDREGCEEYSSTFDNWVSNLPKFLA